MRKRCRVNAQRTRRIFSIDLDAVTCRAMYAFPVRIMATEIHAELHAEPAADVPPPWDVRGRGLCRVFVPVRSAVELLDWNCSGSLSERTPIESKRVHYPLSSGSLFAFGREGGTLALLECVLRA